VIGSDEEGPSPEVRVLMADGLNQANQLPFVHDQFGVAGCEQPAEECHRTTTLMQHCTDAQCVALDD
jgi:hypothetical protein